jgi:DNA-binding MarR family transcriptional regulator
MVSREAATDDRRYLRMELTGMGQQVVETINEGMDDYYARVYAAIPESTRPQVLDSLQVLIKALTEAKCCE